MDLLYVNFLTSETWLRMLKMLARDHEAFFKKFEEVHKGEDAPEEDGPSTPTCVLAAAIVDWRHCCRRDNLFVLGEG